MSSTQAASVTRVQKTGRRFARPGTRADVSRAVGPALQTGGFFLLSLCVCLSIPSPYAAAMLTAMCLKGEKPVWPLCGVALGTLLRALWGIDPDVWQLLGCVLAAALCMKGKCTLLRAALTAGAALSVRAVYALLSGATAEQVILSFFSVPLGIAALPAFLKFAEGRRGRQEQGMDGALCMAFPLLLLFPGAAKLSVLGLNLGLMAAAFFSLCLGGALGGGVGMCAGLLCGLPVALGGYGAAPMLCFSLSGMLCGLMKGRRRPLCALIYLCAVPVAQYAAFRTIWRDPLAAAVAAAVLYCALPKKWIEALVQRVWRALSRSERENAYLRAELSALSLSIERIALALPEIDEPTVDIPDEAERIAASVCVGCDQMAMCFRDRREETVALLQRLAGCGGQETVMRRIIEEGFLACPRAQNIPDIVDEMADRTFEKCRQAARAQNEREMLKGHLSAIAGRMCGIRERAADAGRSREEMEAHVRDALELLNLRARVLWAHRAQGRVSIALLCERSFRQKPPADRLLRVLEHRLNTPLYYAAVEDTRILIRETPPIKLLSGFSSITSAQSPADADAPPENGDAYLLRQARDGQMLIALSDGMGHGEKARRESKKTLEMLALCLEAGYTRDMAMRAVNGMMLAAAQEERYATVDLCTLDLWTGEAILNKLGACPSLLIQGRSIQKICGETLPLGILSHVVPMEHTFRMESGDVLLMMTDGVTDAFPAEDALYAALYRVMGEPPQIIADTLLYEALAAISHRPKDDMSVLCIRTVENEEARLPRRAERA